MNYIVNSVYAPSNHPLKKKNFKEISKFWMIFQQGSSHLAAGALRTNDLHRRQGHGEGRGVLTTTRHLDVSTCEIRNRLVEVGGFPRFFLEKNREKNRGKLDDPQQSSVLSVSCLGAVGSGSSRIPTGNHG